MSLSSFDAGLVNVSVASMFAAVFESKLALDGAVYVAGRPASLEPGKNLLAVEERKVLESEDGSMFAELYLCTER
jgi:hypothetical protein